MPCPCLGSVSGQCAELLGALSGILVSLGHDLFAAVGADDGRVTTQACGGAREMIAGARTDHIDLDFVFQRLLLHRFASGMRHSVPRLWLRHAGAVTEWPRPAEVGLRM